MAPRVDPVRSDDVLPDRVGVVVIGGGIIGVSTAYFLAQKGIPTLLCEKGHIAGEQSSRNWGWCRKTGRDPREIPLIIESLRLWKGMNAMVGAETGFREAGIVHLCDTEAELGRCEAWLNHARPYQLDAKIVTGQAVTNLLGPSSRSWVAALHTPSDGRAEPRMATPAIANAARALGAKILAPCAVRGIETTGGRVTAAITERGRVLCDAIVLAGGIWSRLFCGNLDIELPQLKVMTSVVRTARIDGGPECAASGPSLAFRKTMDGGYVISQSMRNVVDVGPDNFRLLREFFPVLRERWKKLRLRLGRQALREWTTPRHWALDRPSPFEGMRTVDPEPYMPFALEAFRNTGNAFPFFHRATIAESWAGMIDVTPDVVPVMSSVESLPGFFIATGFSGHGFGIGPGAGKLMADLVTGDKPIVDPTPFLLSRYAGGLRPQPSPLAI